MPSDQQEGRKRGPGQPRRFQSAEELQAKIDAYFEDLKNSEKTYFNEKTGLPMVVRKPAYFARLLLHLECTYSTIEPYERGDYDEGAEGALKFSEVFARARLRCEADLAEGGVMGLYDSKTVTAALGHYHKYAEKHEITGANGGPIEFRGVLDEWSK
jgi:hypothetical protein